MGCGRFFPLPTPPLPIFRTSAAAAGRGRAGGLGFQRIRARAIINQLVALAIAFAAANGGLSDPGFGLPPPVINRRTGVSALSRIPPTPDYFLEDKNDRSFFWTICPTPVEFSMKRF